MRKNTVDVNKIKNIIRLINETEYGKDDESFLEIIQTLMNNELLCFKTMSIFSFNHELEKEFSDEEISLLEEMNYKTPKFIEVVYESGGYDVGSMWVRVIKNKYTDKYYKMSGRYDSECGLFVEQNWHEVKQVLKDVTVYQDKEEYSESFKVLKDFLLGIQTTDPRDTSRILNLIANEGSYTTYYPYDSYVIKDILERECGYNTSLNPLIDEIIKKSYTDNDGNEINFFTKNFDIVEDVNEHIVIKRKGGLYYKADKNYSDSFSISDWRWVETKLSKEFRYE